MWGRLKTCGRLATGLLVRAVNLPRAFLSLQGAGLLRVPERIEPPFTPDQNLLSL
jgi:hypothetical protein